MSLRRQPFDPRGRWKPGKWYRNFAILFIVIAVVFAVFAPGPVMILAALASVLAMWFSLRERQRYDR